jgi:hypothetical protein
MNWLSHLCSNRNIPGFRARRKKPNLEILEDRTVPSSTGFITSNFNGTAIHPGSTVWFNSIVKVTGVGAAGATIHIDQSTINYTVNGQTTQVAVPEGTLVFLPNAASATTTFDPGSGWTTTVPVGVGGNVFLTGYGLSLPNGLPGGANPVTWTGNFETDTSGVSLHWQFAAAVYTQFSTDNNALNVKPVDSNSASAYHNSDHAGTPEAFKAFVTGGARGGGGSNWTGSYSSTVSVTPSLGLPGGGIIPGAVITPASLSGFVLDETTGGGLSGVTVTLSTINSQGQSVIIASIPTGSNGAYSFTGLAPGNYTITVSLPDLYADDVAMNQVGSAGGTTSNNQFNVTLGAGVNATDYTFQSVLVIG